MKAPEQDFAVRFAVLQKALLCFDTVDKSPRFNHSNKTYRAVRLHVVQFIQRALPELQSLRCPPLLINNK